jgi:hypothetical protein
MSTFSVVQSKCHTADNNQPDLLPLSHQYRCIINACIDDLNHAADSVNDKSSQELQEMSEIFYKVFIDSIMYDFYYYTTFLMIILF